MGGGIDGVCECEEGDGWELWWVLCGREWWGSGVGKCFDIVVDSDGGGL